MSKVAYALPLPTLSCRSESFRFMSRTKAELQCHPKRMPLQATASPGFAQIGSRWLVEHLLPVNGKKPDDDGFDMCQAAHASKAHRSRPAMKSRSEDGPWKILALSVPEEARNREGSRTYHSVVQSEEKGRR